VLKPEHFHSKIPLGKFDYIQHYQVNNNHIKKNETEKDSKEDPSPSIRYNSQLHGSYN
jgi:hypothetical protein